MCFIRTSAKVFSLTSAMTLALGGGAMASSINIDKIVDIYENANKYQNYVMVMAHKGGIFKDGLEVRAENSRAAINHSISLGVDLLELDVRATKDGVLIMSHSTYLEGASNCSGRIEDTNFADIQGCRLVIESSGEVTDEGFLTLEETLQLTKDKIMVNLDLKVSEEDLDDIRAVVEAADVPGQVIVAVGGDNAAERIENAMVKAAFGDAIEVVPNIYDLKMESPDALALALDELNANSSQGRDEWHLGEPLTTDGGPLFNADAQATAEKYDIHLWVNTLGIEADSNIRAGGRGDGMAVLGGNPDDSWGFWAHLATIFQADEVDYLIDYLAVNGFRDATPTVAPVPLPAGIWLLGAAIGAIAIGGRRKAA